MQATQIDVAPYLAIRDSQRGSGTSTVTRFSSAVLRNLAVYCCFAKGKATVCVLYARSCPLSWTSRSSVGLVRVRAPSQIVSAGLCLCPDSGLDLCLLVGRVRGRGRCDSCRPVERRLLSPFLLQRPPAYLWKRWSWSMLCVRWQKGGRRGIRGEVESTWAGDTVGKGQGQTKQQSVNLVFYDTPPPPASRLARGLSRVAIC